MKERIIEKFGNNAFKYALFYNNEDGLRFELSEGGSYVDLFITAFNKIRDITSNVIRESDDQYVCLKFYGFPGYLKNKKVFKSIKDCQVKIPKGKLESWDEFDEEQELTIRYLLFPSNNKDIYKLIWGALAGDLRIKPKLLCSVYIVNYDLGVIAHPYDDRGMDIIGPNKVLLKQLYKDHHNILLDYDIEKMQKSFG